MLVAALVVGSRIHLLSPPMQTAITTLVLLPKATTRRTDGAGDPPEPHLAPVVPIEPVVPSPSAITYPSADDTVAPVDWAAEAHKAAAAITNSNAMPSAPPDRRKTSSAPGPRPWFPHSAHHAGEQYKTNDGDSIVWISDKCYVKSSKQLLGVPDLIARSMLSGTVCPGNSGTARGDLFEELPAYKKHHPDR